MSDTAEGDGEVDGEEDSDAEGEADGDEEAETDGELDAEDDAEVDGEEDGTESFVIICAARTKLAFSNISSSSMLRAAPSMRVFSSRTIPP